MTRKTRIGLGLILLVPAMVIIAVIGLVVFDAVRPLPPIRPLPDPNGYDGLVKAGAMADTNTGDFSEMKPDALRRLVAKNSDALQAARTSLLEDCAVPLQFSEDYINRHLSELADYKRLAQAFAAEGRLADSENRPGDAVKSYLDAIRLGNKSGRGGVLIDQLVGTAIESIGTAHLQKLVDRLDAKSCRETTATLELLDAQRQSWADILQQEHAWSRRTFPGIKYKLGELVMSSSLKKALQKAERRFNEQGKTTRQLLIDFATRTYELEKGRRPANLADLVPDYLKAVPQDTFTGTNMTCAR